jgi:hypothetical protein
MLSLHQRSDAMIETIKVLVAKAWKDEEAELEPGLHEINEEFVVRVCGTVEKYDDELVTPTVSVPLISVLALFWDKAGLGRDQAMILLREAITEAMTDGVKEDRHIKERIDDVGAAIKAVRDDLLAKLPKMHRSGRVITKGLAVTVLPTVTVEERFPAAVA